MEKFYKVLRNGKSCHGGSGVSWSLPVDATPGEWHVYDRPVELCAAGFHVTTNPSKWWIDGCTVFEADVGDGEILVTHRDSVKAKIVVPKVRLLRVVPMIKIENGSWVISQDESKSSGWTDPVKVK